jgi:hypothetical protein
MRFCFPTMWVAVLRLSSREGLVVAVAVLAATFVALFIRFISAFAYLPGTDAYYYALQAQSVLDFGHLKVPDHGAIPYLVAGLARLGLTVEAAFRVVISGFFALYQLGMLFLVLRLKGWAQPFAALLWALSCPLIAFHAIEFPSLTLGVATLPWWFWLALNPIRKRIFWLATLLAASAAVHPAAAALGFLFVLFAATIAIRQIWSKRGWLREHKPLGVVLLLAVCILLAVAVGALFLTVKGRLTELRPGLPGLLGLVNSADVPREVMFTVVLEWLLLFTTLVIYSYSKARPARWKFLAMAALALPLWPDREIGFGGMGGRLAVLFVLLALPLIVTLWGDLEERSNLFARRGQPKMRVFAAIGILIAVAVLPLRLQAYHDLLTPDDYASYEKVVAALRGANIPILIAHRGLDFFYSYRLRRDAFHFDPEANWNRTEIWRVAVRITPEEVAYYSPPQCPWGQTARMIQGTGYVLVREDCWEQLRTQITRDENPDLYAEVWKNMENPSQARPDFLRIR